MSGSRLSSPLVTHLPRCYIVKNPGENGQSVVLTWKLPGVVRTWWIGKRNDWYHLPLYNNDPWASRSRDVASSESVLWIDRYPWQPILTDDVYLCLYGANETMHDWALRLPSLPITPGGFARTQKRTELCRSTAFD